MRWSDETKAKVAADLAAGMTVKDVAARYGMPRGTVGHLAPTSKRGALKISKIANLKDLEAEFRNQLALNFAAQAAILGKFSDAAWLDRQGAVDLTGSYATLFTKGGKLLGALYGPPAAPLGDDTGDREDPA